MSRSTLSLFEYRGIILLHVQGEKDFAPREAEEHSYTNYQLNEGDAGQVG